MFLVFLFDPYIRPIFVFYTSSYSYALLLFFFYWNTFVYTLLSLIVIIIYWFIDCILSLFYKRKVQEGIAFTFYIYNRNCILHFTSPYIIILHFASYICWTQAYLSLHCGGLTRATDKCSVRPRACVWRWNCSSATDSHLKQFWKRAQCNWRFRVRKSLSRQGRRKRQSGKRAG